MTCMKNDVLYYIELNRHRAPAQVIFDACVGIYSEEAIIDAKKILIDVHYKAVRKVNRNTARRVSEEREKIQDIMRDIYDVLDVLDCADVELNIEAENPNNVPSENPETKNHHPIIDMIMSLNR